MSRVTIAMGQRLGKLAALATFLVTTSQAASAGFAQWTEKTYTIPELAELASPAVVYVGILNADGELVGQGSGFVVKPDGVVVTNYHVIDGAQGLIVRMLDGEIYDRVRVVDYDRRRDLAVLKIPAFKTLPTVAMGDTSTVKVGQQAVAIGNPEGLEHTVSSGVVSAFRKTEGYRLMQISVPISHGSSGGPLFDLRGNVIGITTSGVVSEGAQNLNFAVPIEYVRPLLETKSEPVPVAEVTRSQGGSASGRGEQQASAQQERMPDPANVPGMAWPVAHDHEGPFDKYCLGYLYVSEGMIGYTNDTGIHNWAVPLSGVKEIKKNTFYGSEYGAFHVKLVTGSNYNFVVVNDQLQFQSPDQLLIMISQALEEARK